MKNSLRFAALTAILAVSIWAGAARTSQALDPPCSTYPSGLCQIGETTTCSEGWSTRNCECVDVAGRGRWLCFY